MEGKTATGRGDIISSETYGTSRANAYKILEETLNLKDVRIYDTIEDTAKLYMVKYDRSH